MAEFEGGQPKIKNLQVEPGAGPSSLFILSDTNFIRRFTLFLIEWPPFEYTILLTIIGEFTFKLQTKEFYRVSVDDKSRPFKTFKIFTKILTAFVCIKILFLLTRRCTVNLEIIINTMTLAWLTLIILYIAENNFDCYVLNVSFSYISFLHH